MPPETRKLLVLLPRRLLEVRDDVAHFLVDVRRQFTFGLDILPKLRGAGIDVSQ